MGVQAKCGLGAKEKVSYFLFCFLFNVCAMLPFTFGILELLLMSLIGGIAMYLVTIRRMEMLSTIRYMKKSSNGEDEADYHYAGYETCRKYRYVESINELRRSLSKMLVNTADGSLPSYEEIDELERALNRVRELKRELEFG